METPQLKTVETSKVQRHVYKPVEDFSFSPLTTGFSIPTSLKLTINTPEQRQANHSCAFIVDFEGKFSTKIEINR